MNSRNSTIDIARGFIVLLLPAIHVTLFYGDISVQRGVWGVVLNSVSQVAGAQLVLFLMGFSFFLGRDKPLKFIFKRTMSLLLLAYTFSLIGFVLPTVFGLMPVSFFTYYKIPTGFWGALDLLMIGNIFQLAAIGYLTCGVLYHFRVGFTPVAAAAFLLAITSPAFWGVRPHNFLINYLLKLFNGYPPAVFFPAFPWAVYPLLGYVFGNLYQHLEEEEFYQIALKTGAAAIVFGLIGMLLEPKSYNLTIYRLGPSGTLLHCGLVLLWLNTCHFAAIKLKRFKRILSLLEWCSVNITVIYIFQWIFICWLAPVFGFMQQGFIGTLKAIITVSALTGVTVAAAKLYKRRKQKSGRIMKKLSWIIKLKNER